MKCSAPNEEVIQTLIAVESAEECGRVLSECVRSDPSTRRERALVFDFLPYLGLELQQERVAVIEACTQMPLL